MGVRLITQVAEDLATTPVQDTVMTADEGLKAILTMSAEFFTEATRAHLRAGVFRVGGKVTRVLTRVTTSTCCGVRCRVRRGRLSAAK